MSEQAQHTDETDAIVVTLTTARARLGISMRAVAREAGVSPACVHSWEHGTRAPSLHNLRAWARALGRDLVLTCSTQPAMQGLTEKAADPFREGECGPRAGCGCSCHAFPGVSHVAPCCDEPPMSNSPGHPTSPEAAS